MPDFDLIVAGELNPDLILSDARLEPHFGQREILVEKADLTIGASSAITACGAARLGLRVAMIGVVGDDLFGQFMRESLGRRGIDMSAVIVDPTLRTGVSVILDRGGDRAILTYSGAIGALRAEQVTDRLLQRARHLHIASYFLQTNLQPGLPDLLRRARGLGLSVSLDTNWDPDEGWVGVQGALAWVDVFLPNEAEARAIASVSTLTEAMEHLAQLVPTVAVKLGRDGAVGRRGSETIRVPALPVQVVDTVGAGDSFNAGFLYGYLQGWSLARSLQLAVACGSLSTRAAGGTSAQPDLAEATSRMGSLP
jgi:sugar/nucleoside kinase (ribokinase family)